MKIFVLTSELNYRNGLGRYSVDMVEAMRSGGVDVSVATAFNGVNDTPTETLNILPKALDYRSSYLFAIWIAWKLRGHAKDSDLIHSFSEQYSYIAYWLSKMTGKKFFITAHGTWAVEPFTTSFIKRYFHRKSFESALKVICVSSYTKERLEAYGLHNLCVINNGINFAKFTKAPLPNWSERENFIVTVGNLKNRKGYHVSIQAFAKAQGRINDLRYCIVGDQSDKAYLDKLEKLALSLGVRDKIEFLQHISDEELVGIYRKAKMFVLTSISEGSHFEGFGLVYLEANACGLPVVGSLESGAQDAITSDTGFLVRQGDSQAVAEAIEKIVGDDKLAEAISEKAVEWAEKHDMSKVAQEYRRLYESGSLNKIDK